MPMGEMKNMKMLMMTRVSITRYRSGHQTEGIRWRNRS